MSTSASRFCWSRPLNGSSSSSRRGSDGERAGEQPALALAARELAEPALREVGEADRRERAAHGLAIGAPGPAEEPEPAVAALHHDLLEADREVGVELGGLGQEADHAVGHGAVVGPGAAVAASAACVPIVTRPAVSGTRPSMPFSRVDLPAPFGPMRATASPGAISRSRPIDAGAARDG